MTELLTAAQMRAIEAAAIASGEVTGLELMERAGSGVVEAVLAEWPELALTSHKAVVLCGPGNNGGDGFVVARLLKERGWEVEVFLYGDEAKLPVDAKVNCERWKGVGEVRAAAEFLKPTDGIPDLLIDAIFGTGLTRPISDETLATVLWYVDDSAELKAFSAPEWSAKYGGCRVVSVDVPTGICADSGRVLSSDTEFGKSSTIANLTVTFHRQKLGHVLSSGPRQSQKVRVVDIGLKTTELTNTTQLVCPDLLKLTKQVARHKFSHGHALILSGPSGHGGAARLAARGALRIGAGLVTLAVPPEALPENAARVDAVMLRVVGDAAGLAEVLEDKRINAMCVGPGLGVERAREVLGVALDRRGEPRPTVIDADGLTALAGDAGLFAQLHEGCVLTPHGGEFARVFPDIAARLAEPATKGPAYSKVDATREAAKRAGCVVLFKGADTVIAGPDGRCSVNSAHYERAAPWLATAGSGDVLAGFICGLLARGFGAMQAAETAAWLHVECAIKFGPGLIAEDLPEVLPAVLHDLGV